MNFVLQPWQLLLVIAASWINQQQQQVIDYLLSEHQVLKETPGKKRILLSDDQRRRLAVKGKISGRKALKKIATPDTLLRWHRQLVAAKWDYSERKNKPGRPPVNTAGAIWEISACGARAKNGIVLWSARGTI